MTRLLINLFFIVILCFTLAVMPVNTEILELFDFGTLFASDEPEEVIETDPVDETFIPTFSLAYSMDDANRMYNPTSATIDISTNIPSKYEENYAFDDLEMTLYRNDEVYQIFTGQQIIENITKSYIDDQMEVAIAINISFEALDLDTDGFYDMTFDFTSAEKADLPASTFKVAYRPAIDYVTNGEAENNGNFIYKAYFLNATETRLVPLYFSVKYPESITVEARNRLYLAPDAKYGLSTKQVIPNKTSISKIGTKHYGVFFYSNQFPGIIDDAKDAHLAVEALVKTLIRLPHIEKISFFVDDAQVEGSFFDIDLSQIYTEPKESYVYLTEANTTNKRYLIPARVSEDNIYDEVWAILSALKTGETDDGNFIPILPPEVEVSNFIIEGTTLTLDMNPAFTSVYADLPVYEEMMLNSLLYSLTSIENINKVAFTIEGEPLTSFAGMDLSEPVLAPPYINYIGEY